MPPRKPAKSNPALRFALVRQWHVYISVFIAPTMLFFALTGALQTFRIPDKPDAPATLVKMARLHRDDVFALKPPPKKPAAAEARPAEAPKPKPKPLRSTTVFKWFAVGVAVAFIATTLLGLWMALAYHKRKGLLWLVLLAGAAAPALIVALL